MYQTKLTFSITDYNLRPQLRDNIGGKIGKRDVHKERLKTPLNRVLKIVPLTLSGIKFCHIRADINFD